MWSYESRNHQPGPTMWSYESHNHQPGTTPCSVEAGSARPQAGPFSHPIQRATTAAASLWYFHRVRPSFFAIIALVISAALFSCGGAQQAKASATSARDSDSVSTGPAAPPPPQLPSCDDGSCFRCGDGICPSGFYCESNGGMTGCQWSTQCAKAPTCSCLRPALQADPRCSCEDRNGAAFVSCSR